MLDLAEQLEHVMPTALTGTVAQTKGMTVSVAGFPASVGTLAEIERETSSAVPAEVIGFRDQLTVLYPFTALAGVRHANCVRLSRTSHWLGVGDALLGRVIGADGSLTGYGGGLQRKQALLDHERRILGGEAPDARWRERQLAMV